MTTMSARKTKERTLEELMRSKEIYKKHALRCKQAGYPDRLAKRMLAYSALLTKMIADYGARK